MKAMPHVRAALVAFHVLAITLVAIPAPVGGLDRRAWKDPSVQDELRAWSARFGIPEPVFEDKLYALAVADIRFRDKALRPAFDYVDLTGCDQPWRMFAGPHRYPATFFVEEQMRGDPYDAWHVLFEERSREHAWHREFFDQERVRSQVFRWGWPDFAWAARDGCNWIAKQRFAESEETVAVRCRLFRAESPTPEQVRTHTEPPGQWSLLREVRRPLKIHKAGT